MRAWIVRTIGLAAVGVLTLSLSACTVTPYGQIAIGMGPNNELVAFVVMCSHHIDGATVYFDTSHDQAVVGQWAATSPVTGISAFPMVKGGNGWKPTMMFGPLIPGEIYRIYGWSKDDSASAGGPTFTAKELSILKPWQVWTYGPGDKEQAVSLNYFVTHVCQTSSPSP
jgi:hypothetical protein